MNYCDLAVLDREKELNQKSLVIDYLIFISSHPHLWESK